MTDPYYWYVMSNHEAMRSVPPPSIGELLLIVLIPLAMTVVFVGFVLRESPSPPPRRGAPRLARRERRTLAAIERSLRELDPELADQLDGFAVASASARPGVRPAPRHRAGS